MIQFDHFSFSYGDSGREQLHNFTFTVQPAEFVLLCGKSACGKTTATKCINGLIPHFTPGKTAGRVWVKGRDVAATPSYALAEDVGSVFQNPKTQFFNLDSDSELVFGLENLGTDPTSIRRRVKTVTEDLQIENLLGRNVFALSGGEKQILALASVYAVNPDVYVLDEPTANMDRASVQRLHDILKKLKAMGKTIVISEHRLFFLMDLVDTALYIDHGEILQVLSGDDFRRLDKAERIRLGLRCFSLGEDRNRQPSRTDSGLLTVKHLTVAHKKQPLVQDISFAANSGDIIAVTGSNGCGKTSFLRVLCGLAKEAGGSIAFDGKTLTDKKRRALCTMTMQDVVHQLFSDSVREEFSLLNCDCREEDVTAILEALDLLEAKDKHPMTLSGGQKQRLALAVAAVSNKQIMIFDEPTSGLDYGNMCKVSQLIRSISPDKIIFIATHDRELIQMVCNREIELDETGVRVFDLADQRQTDFSNNEYAL